MNPRLFSFLFQLLCFCGYALAQNQGITFSETFSRQCFAEGDVWTQEFVIRNTSANTQLVQVEFYLQDGRLENVLLASQILSSSGVTLLQKVGNLLTDIYYFQMSAGAELNIKADFRIDKLVISDNIHTDFGAVYLNYLPVSNGFSDSFDVCPVEYFSIMDCELPRQIQLPQLDAQSYRLLAPPLLDAAVSLSAKGVLSYVPPQVSAPAQDRITYEIVKTNGSVVTGQIDIDVLPCIKAETKFTSNDYCNDDCQYSGPSILINEVMTTPLYYNGAIFGTQCGTSEKIGGEWVELYNPDTCNSVDISGYFFANSTQDALSNGRGGCTETSNLGSAFVLPEGTIVPPNGFAVLRGERAVLVDAARLVENGGNTVVVNLVDYFDRFCKEGDRFWLPDRGGWFGFYNKEGLPQDAIYWGDPAYLCADCTPCNPQVAGSFAGTLGSLNAFPNDRKTRVSDFDVQQHFGQSPKRIPDGAAWTFNDYTEASTGYCNAGCNRYVSADCNGTATVTPIGTGNYSFQWNDAQAQTTSTATGLCEGTYCCTVTDNVTRLSQLFCVTVSGNVDESSTIEKSICEDETYLFDGKQLTESGTYLGKFKNVYGCDSLVTLNLNVEQAKRREIEATICDSESYLFDGKQLTTGGTYIGKFPGIHGCDSTVTLNLKVNPTDYKAFDILIKDTESYFFAGKELNQSGTYTDRQKNVYGCDSITVLSLRVLPDAIAPPEVFTPNDDGTNDYFEIPNLELYPKNSILIFNRWGNKVFEASPYLNDWDGRNHFGLHTGGDRLPAGTYFYILNLGDGSEPRKGYVYLMVGD